MISYTPTRRAARPEPRHLFAIGDAVHMKSGFRQLADEKGVYRVTATMPARDGVPQYRIRNDDERHERVTTQEHLLPANSAPQSSRSSLIERTFRHG